jgi:hypothetical protein
MPCRAAARLGGKLTSRGTVLMVVVVIVVAGVAVVVAAAAAVVVVVVVVVVIRNSIPRAQQSPAKKQSSREAHPGTPPPVPRLLGVLPGPAPRPYSPPPAAGRRGEPHKPFLRLRTSQHAKHSLL